MRKIKLKMSLAIILLICGFAFFGIPYIMKWPVDLAVRGYVGGVLSLSMAASIGKSVKDNLKEFKEVHNGNNE